MSIKAGESFQTWCASRTCRTKLDSPLVRFVRLWNAHTRSNLKLEMKNTYGVSLSSPDPEPQTVHRRICSIAHAVSCVIIDATSTLHLCDEFIDYLVRPNWQTFFTTCLCRKFCTIARKGFIRTSLMPTRDSEQPLKLSKFNSILTVDTN